jgi:hypothetical protein
VISIVQYDRIYKPVLNFASQSFRMMYLCVHVLNLSWDADPCQESCLLMFFSFALVSLFVPEIL